MVDSLSLACFQPVEIHHSGGRVFHMSLSLACFQLGLARPVGPLAFFSLSLACFQLASGKYLMPPKLVPTLSLACFQPILEHAREIVVHDAS